MMFLARRLEEVFWKSYMREKRKVFWETSIKAIIQFTRNSYTLQLDDRQETMIPLSKQSEKELQTLLDY